MPIPSFLTLGRVAVVGIILPAGLTMLVGCASTVKSVASTAGAAAGRAAAPALVDQLDALNQPENQNKVLAFSQSPAVQVSAHAVGNGVGEGITDEFVAIAAGDADAATTQPGAATRSATRAQLRQLLQQDVTPAVNALIHSAIEQAVRDLTSQDVQTQVTAMSQSMAEGALRGGIRAFRQEGPTALADMIREQIAPAIGDAIRQQLAKTLSEQSESNFMQAFHRLFHQEIMPAIHDLWDQGTSDTLLLPTRADLAPAVRANAQNLAEGTTTGTHLALIQLGVLSPSGDLTGAFRAFIWGGAIVLALIGLAALAVLLAAATYAIGLWRRPAGRISR